MEFKWCLWQLKLVQLTIKVTEIKVTIKVRFNSSFFNFQLFFISNLKHCKPQSCSLEFYWTKKLAKNGKYCNLTQTCSLDNWFKHWLWTILGLQFSSITHQLSSKQTFKQNLQPSKIETLNSSLIITHLWTYSAFSLHFIFVISFNLISHLKMLHQKYRLALVLRFFSLYSFEIY